MNAEIGIHKCSACGTPIMSASVYCIQCYRERLVHCETCCIMTLAGRLRQRPEPLHKDEQGKCRDCHGERWILRG